MLWDVASGQPLRSFSGHSSYVTSVAFSPDGKTTISGSDDNTLKLWRIDTLDQLVQWTYANRAVRELTCAERSGYNVEPTCDAQGNYPTRTPYLTWTPSPTATASPTANLTQTTATPTPSITPTLPTWTPTSTATATGQLIRTQTLALLLPAETQTQAARLLTATLVTFTPTATAAASKAAQVGDNRGEISASGGQVWSYNGQAGEMLTLLVTADHPANDAQDRTGLLDTIVTVRSPDGQVLNQADDIDPGILTDSRIDGLTLPVTGVYEIEVRSWDDASGGAYSLTIEFQPRHQCGVNRHAAVIERYRRLERLVVLIATIFSNQGRAR